MATADQELMQEVENILLSEVDSYRENQDVEDGSHPAEPEEDQADSGEPENASYRLEAAKRQQRKAEEKARKAQEAMTAMQNRLAKLEGRLDERYGDEDLQGEELSEADMASEIRSLRQELIEMKTNSQRKEMKNRENIFIQQHPEALDHMVDLKDFIVARKGLASDVVSGSVSLGEAWYLYNKSLDKEVSRSNTQDSSKVFGNSKREPVKARGKQTYDRWGEANKILSDPNSTNKRDAILEMEDMIAENILSQLH